VHKNAIDDVIAALKLLPQNVKFVILGTGPLETKLKELARSSHLDARTLFLGHIDHKDMPKYLQASDIYIRPSRSEGMGASFIEAFAAGLPVIATQEGGLSDILFDEKRNPDQPITGWAVNRDSPEQIAKAVEEIMSRREKVAAVVATAKEMAIEKYDWNVIARQMQEKAFLPLLEKPIDGARDKGTTH
jgi:glycosyltransferase involved in cell wall biosynthesis